MKTYVISMFAAMVVAFSISGCKSQKINVIHNDTVVTNSVPLKAFNDENYVWESWTIGTNKVDNIDK